LRAPLPRPAARGHRESGGRHRRRRQAYWVRTQAQASGRVVKLSRNLLAHITDADIAAAVAKIRAAIEGNAATSSLTLGDIRQAIQILQAQPKDWPVMQKKQWVAVIKREIAARAEELRRAGVHNPVARAEAEIAERWQHANGAALNRWLRRNR